MELFGFSSPDTRRMHVKQIKKVSLSTGRLMGGIVEVMGVDGIVISAGASPSGDQVAEVEAWMQAVRDAAPNLQQ